MTAEKYKAVRERLGTQAEVALRLGVARSTVADRERGDMRITPEAALALLALKKRSLSATVPQKENIFVPRAGKRSRIPQKEIVK